VHSFCFIGIVIWQIVDALSADDPGKDLMATRVLQGWPWVCRDLLAHGLAGLANDDLL
jgi:hypothetical protein